MQLAVSLSARPAPAAAAVRLGRQQQADVACCSTSIKPSRYRSRSLRNSQKQLSSAQAFITASKQQLLLSLPRPRPARRAAAAAAEVVGGGDDGGEVPAEMGSGARRRVGEELSEPPYNPVNQVMSNSVITATPDMTLASIMHHFAKFTGLPVVDDAGHCIGVVSETDVLQVVKEDSSKLQSTTVREVMSQPITIKEHAPIIFAAGLMLQNKIFRLPVVDNDDKVIAMVTRTDLFQPLIAGVDPLYTQHTSL
eukprot:jgi/Chlat1/4916/Chrsp31S04830